jgi:hypothetical protein
VRDDGKRAATLDFIRYFCFLHQLTSNMYTSIYAEWKVRTAAKASSKPGAGSWRGA